MVVVVFFFFAVTGAKRGCGLWLGPVMIFFNGLAPVGFKSAAWADGFLVPWLWLLMG